MRTFVFISDIPDFLLQPVLSTSAAAGGSRSKAHRDPRYERLRRLLADQSSGVMLVMHLESKGYGLALYATEEEALAACKANITPEQPGEQYPPLRLRIVEREKAAPPEAVYSPSIVIEGQTVLKSTLANTRGLELAYRGKAVPKWCPHTLAQEDCLFGTSCHRVHRHTFQRTVRKRPRVEDGDAFSRLSESDAQKVCALVKDPKRSMQTLVPHQLQPTPCTYVHVTLEEVEELVAGSDSSLQRLKERVELACAQDHIVGPLFIKLGFQGGAPWDWSLYDEKEGGGLARLRACCSLPPNGAQTPLERDILCQQLLYWMNQQNRFEHAVDALHALRCSERVKEGLRAFVRSRGPGTAECESNLYLCVQKWLYLPTAGCEVSVFLERGGQRVRGVVQRYSQLRLMSSASLLASSSSAAGQDAMQAALLRFALLGKRLDTEAENALEIETYQFGKRFFHAVERLRHHIYSHVQPTETVATAGDSKDYLPSGSAWCARLAVVLDSPVSGTTSCSSSVVVLSFAPYHRALEECPLYTHISGDAPCTEVVWNLQKHSYVPLLSRDIVEKLHQSSPSN